MYDINFFQKSKKIKDKIVKGDFQPDDAGSIEKELETLRSQSPRVFNIETTNYCNMKCVMCARTELMTRDNIWIDDDTFLKVIDQIQPYSTKDLDKFWDFIEHEYNSYGNELSENTFYLRVVSRCVILHGFGEPLLDKKIVDRVKACSDRGISTYFSCVPANLTVERAEEVMKAGLTVFKFSIDALDDEWQKKIRGKQNNFEASYRTILDIIDLKETKGYKTLLVPCMIALSEDERAQNMHSSFMQLWEGKDVFAYVKSQDNRWLYQEDESIVNRSHYASQYCEYPWTSITVMANGSVVPCTQDYDTEMVLGDVNKKGLQAIWNDEPLEQLRRMHITGEFPPGHKCQERCDQKKLYEYLKESGEKNKLSKLKTFKQVPRLFFGSGSLQRIKELVPNTANSGYTLFVVDDVLKENPSILEFLDKNNQRTIWFPASLKEPTIKQVDDIRDELLSSKNGLPEVIIGVGGGSTMDVAKAVSVMLTNKGSSADYQGWDLLKNPGIFKIGVPTVSGSGAEASRSAVLMGKDRKFGINDDYSMFDAVVLDSSLITGVPKEQRFYSGMDCYIHCVESLQGTMTNELSRSYASKALELCENFFVSEGGDDELMTASYMGGVSIVNSEVGICHALSYGLSLELGYRHGFANCVVFKVLDEYYGPWVKKFKQMLLVHSMQLPENVCANLGEEAMQRMVNMTLRMERPLTNALGENWRKIFSKEKIRELYQRM